MKQALKTLGWQALKQHLSTVDLNPTSLSELLGYIRRNTDFLLKRPDEPRATMRAAFVEELSKFIENHLGADAAELVRAEMVVIQHIETGYREILRTQEATVAAKLLPDIQASAALSRSAYAYHELMSAFHSATRRRKELTLQSFRIRNADGSSYSPDGVLAGIVDITTMTLMLLAHRYKWFDSENFLVLPNLADVTENEVFKAGLTEALAASWRHWERMEQRCRYFGGEINLFNGINLPDWAPTGAETAIEYQLVSEVEFYDYLANERLNDRLIQTFQEMAIHTNMHGKVSGIDTPLGLPPGVFVSAEEAHSGVSLCEILGYSIVDDHERPCGLRLVEWVRGYAVLKCLADERYSKNGKDGLCFIIPRQTLLTVLDRVGLKNGVAETFINQASLRASSRDLFDQPLVRTQDGSLLVFGPGILNSDLARVTLSAIGNQSQKLGRKGKSFEQETLRFFDKQGLVAKSFNFKNDGEEFEYDAVVPWENYVFVLECKNRTLSGHNPIAAYYFGLEIASAIDQVKRLAKALLDNSAVVLARSGIDVTNKIIVPCVVNSLPYAMTGDKDGVYVTDASSMKRFFQERHFHIIRPHHLKAKAATILHRTAMKALWRGDQPTPADLVSYLADPLQLQLMTGHTKKRVNYFGLGERTVVAATDLAHDEMTTSSVAKLFSIDESWVQREAEAVTRAIRDATRKHEERSVRAADRGWRAQQKRR